MWRHPKYYKELRKLRNNLDQAISGKNSTECKTRSPGPGLKQQASSTKPQAASKPEPVQVLQIFNTCVKPQATSVKLQAASSKLLDSRTTEQEN